MIMLPTLWFLRRCCLPVNGDSYHIRLSTKQCTTVWYSVLCGVAWWRATSYCTAWLCSEKGHGLQHACSYLADSSPRTVLNFPRTVLNLPQHLILASDGTFQQNVGQVHSYPHSHTSLMVNIHVVGTWLCVHFQKTEDVVWCDTPHNT